MAVENLNSEMLRQRMMRGVVTGVAEPEKAPLKLCGGKVNGRPCRITVLSDEDFCRQHKKEMEMARNHCGINGCTRPVKNMGDKCWQHKGLDDQVAVGAVSDSALDHGHVDAATCTGSGLAAAAPPPQEIDQENPPATSTVDQLSDWRTLSPLALIASEVRTPRRSLLELVETEAPPKHSITLDLSGKPELFLAICERSDDPADDIIRLIEALFAGDLFAKREGVFDDPA